MKKNTGNKIRLGIFVSIGLALFILGIYFIGNRQQLFSTTFRVSAVFKDVSGLQVGNNVRFAGIVVGTVDNVEIISDTTVRVEMIIEEKVRKFIKRDAKAIIGTDGLMGNKIMSISPGTSGEVIQNGDYIRTAKPISIDDILEQIKKTSENATRITGDFSAITSYMRSGKGTIGKLFMDTVFAEELDQTIVNIKQGAGGFKQNMDKAGDSFLFRKLFNRKKGKSK